MIRKSWIEETIEAVERIMQRQDNAVEQAKLLGTYNADDRSRQYPIDDPAQLKKAVNQAWTKIHSCERQLAEKDRTIGKLEANNKIAGAGLKLWVKMLLLVITLQCGVIGFLAHELLSRLH